ncbi:MAG: zinc-ribbon domain-containing protein [Christensenellales bacterium]
MKYCINCGKQIADDATFCEHCGNRQYSDEVNVKNSLDSESNYDKSPDIKPAQNVGAITTKPTFSKKKILIIVACVVLAVILLVVLLTQCNGGGLLVSKEDLAVTCAKSLVIDNLKNPNSAIWYATDIVDKDDYDRYIVYLDYGAENSFGGTTRTRLYVCIRLDNNDTYYYNPYFPYVEATDMNLSLIKSLNDWGNPPEK